MYKNIKSFSIFALIFTFAQLNSVNGPAIVNRHMQNFTLKNNSKKTVYYALTSEPTFKRVGQSQIKFASEEVKPLAAGKSITEGHLKKANENLGIAFSYKKFSENIDLADVKEVKKNNIKFKAVPAGKNIIIQPEDLR